MKPVTIAIAGCGSRGMNCYARMHRQFEGRMKIVAAADLIAQKRQKMQDEYGVSPEMCFETAEEMLSREKLADVVLVATPDRAHFGHASAALRRGYHLLLEKPISLTEEECLGIQQLAHEYDRHVVVCHVLRYAPFYQQVKQIMDSGEIGEIVNIQATEGVAYWHQAHSYVRGNWRRKCDSSPMILAKCCHDMDLFLWLTGRHCKSVSSVGSLRHFKADNAPEGAPLRCTDGCPAADSCPYNAVRFYLGGVDSGKKDWPINVLAVEPTHDSILDALKNGPYGRCVYHCDNDVVDHQIVNLEMEDELTVSFTMTGFSAINGRRINVMGTHGEIRGDMDENIIRVMPFAKEAYTIDVKTISNDFSGHGGGDARLMDDFLRLVSGEGTLGGALTSIDRSVESHLVALAAEKSRMEGGKLIRL